MKTKESKAEHVNLPGEGEKSSAIILSKTADTSCLTVAEAVLFVVLFFVKCSLKHNTIAWKHRSKFRFNKF